MESEQHSSISEGQKWFSLAIQAGHFSLDHKQENYVGDYMYMGCADGLVYFKHEVTRQPYNVKVDKLIGKKSKSNK